MNEQEKLIQMVERGTSPFGSVQEALRRLTEAGFAEISYAKTWRLEPGGKYVVSHHGTALFAFTLGEEPAGGMLRMAAAHTDYPCFRLKPNPDFQTDVYAQVNVEVYGGPILNTWLDRPLGIAGRVALRSDHPWEPEIRLYQSTKPVLTIPNLAIHMNREVNKGVELNAQTDLMPILDLLPKEEKRTDYFLCHLSEELGVDKKDILDFELSVFVMENPCYIGAADSFLSAPRLDNQTSVSALVSALIDGKRSNGINLIALFDHEEIGNTSKQGAASILLHDMAERIWRNLGMEEEQVAGKMYEAMLLSADVAHGMHPNYKGKMDPLTQPVPGQGFCIKEACSQSYATDAQAVSILRQICDSRQIPYQRFVNRSDVRGGGTLGSVASTLFPVKTVDIGVPILAMHSARELMGAKDIDALKDAVTAYFT